MDYLVEVHSGVIMFAPIKKGKMKALYPLTSDQARMIAQELLKKADEVDSAFRVSK